MNITIFGATGQAGKHIVEEAVSRGHLVTAAVRDETKAVSLPSSVSIHVVDVRDIDAVGGVIEGQNLVLSALRPPTGHEDDLPKLSENVLIAAKKAVVRAIIVGGAASLKLADDSGHTVLSAPNFLPPSVVPIAQACQVQFELFESGSWGNSSYMAPPALFRPGSRRGTYRTGSDTLVTDDAGHSEISMMDFAIAMLDEGENPKNEGRRFTVGY